jgi:Tfp pilus assembly protein FimT
MKRTAFSMLELIFVIIVIGLLAVLSIPNFNRDPVSEAAEQLANHIRYTQHLAMVDDRFDPATPEWYSQMWTLRINQNGGNWIYEVFSDKSNDGAPALAEEAVDPQTGLRLGNNGVGITNLTSNYDITSITTSGGNALNTSGAGIRLTFDSQGRPYRGTPWAAGQDFRTNLMTSDMNITLTGSDSHTAIITVREQTGYVCVLDASTGECQGTK